MQLIDFLPGRLMAGLRPLEASVEVRILSRQLYLPVDFFCKHFN
jgi:hypothetical protein